MKLVIILALVGGFVGGCSYLKVEDVTGLNIDLSPESEEKD